jgi:hypothetical protein
MLRLFFVGSSAMPRVGGGREEERESIIEIGVRGILGRILGTYLESKIKAEVLNTASELIFFLIWPHRCVLQL